jgi:hypothetical protein
MRPHLNTTGALQAIEKGLLIPPSKYAALQRANLIRVKGHGRGAKPVLTDAGRARLSESYGR